MQRNEGKIQVIKVMRNNVFTNIFTVYVPNLLMCLANFTKAYRFSLGLRIDISMNSHELQQYKPSLCSQPSADLNIPYFIAAHSLGYVDKNLQHCIYFPGRVPIYPLEQNSVNIHL